MKTYRVFNKQTGEFLGRLNSEQFHFLAERLELSGMRQRNYFIQKETIDEILNDSPPKGLDDFFNSALRGAPFVELRWEEEKPGSH